MLKSISQKLDIFVGEPWRRRSSALFFYRLTQVLHARTNGRSSRFFRWLAASTRPMARLPQPSFLSGDEIERIGRQLDELGWAIPAYRLSDQDILSLHSFAFSTPCYANDPVGDNILLDEHALRKDHPRFTWRTRDVVRLDAIKRLVSDSGLHAIAQRYLRCQPLLTSVTLWLTTPYEGRYDAHEYHYDNENPKFLKFFIYLTDTSAETGAHYFIQRSHDPVKPRALSRSIRYIDEAVYGIFGRENEKLFAAPAGTIIAEDTMGFHKGSTPLRNYRLLLQLEYALIDAPGEELRCPVIPEPIIGLAPQIEPIVRKFFARA